jgi:hypothetical protein
MADGGVLASSCLDFGMVVLLEPPAVPFFLEPFLSVSPNSISPGNKSFHIKYKSDPSFILWAYTVGI